jgi:hypothetical protein
MCPDIGEERAEFRDADLVYKRLKGRETDIGSKIANQVGRPAWA